MKTMLCLASLAMVFMAGCDLDSHCDPGQIYVDFSCSNPPPDAGPPVVGDPTNPGVCAAYEGFGETCTDVSQCRCGLDSCNTYMGANYCTQSNCLDFPSVCPPTWTCADLSAFGLGSACERPK